MKKFIAKTLACTALVATFGLANAADESFLTSASMATLPELQIDSQEMATTNLAAPKMKCFVDTPALDPWHSPNCFSVGRSRTTAAVFRIDNVPSNFTIYWSDSRCSSSSYNCTLPITQYNTITLNATVLNHSNNTFSTTSSTASYEGFN